MVSTPLHPLDPATAEELEYAVHIVRESLPGVELHFKVAGLEEPPKKEMVKFLEAEHAGRPVSAPNRWIFMMYYIKKNPRLFECIVDITAGEIIHHAELPRTQHAPVDRIELNEAAQVALADQGVKKELERLQIGDNVVVLDPWDYGKDDEYEQRRLTQIFFYKRNPKNNSPDSNHYAFPLDFMAIVDLIEMRVIKICHLPLGAEAITTKHTGARKVQPEYDHTLQSKPARTSLRPLIVTQPEGASFKLTGNLVEWEKWRFRVGFNWREGMILHDVTFDGRPVLFRISLSEMFVPYGDPRDPLHRKGAFDLGNVGAGVTANDLSLGCDCLGLIAYLSGHVINARGEVVEKKNCVCIHEVDAGIQWKHTNHRTGKASVVRKRQLQLQTIITVANYEYIFYYILDQSGEIEFETRATGILSTTPIDPENTDKVPFATRVGNGVLAPYHQHIFNLRIDPAIDSYTNNTVSFVDSVPMPRDRVLNPYGTGYITEETKVTRSSSQQTDPSKARIFKIFNPNKINPVSLSPVGYKLIPINSQALLADGNSWHYRRSHFAEAPIWVTKYKDRELFPAGDYTNQGDGSDGIRNWVARNDNVENEDIVLWHTYTFTHNPRPEDFPIMPAESVRVALKPYSFFNYNPTMDVPPSNQGFNKSTAYDPTLQVGADGVGRDAGPKHAASGGEGESCCPKL
ncbi:primary-amine oxidase [Capronia epimyces CBS 606.96]|uniref:Amine oxidase n=1 Tax=Capronia epimyces CBS 606.96 TaxID=1182542 RepID=W9YCF7_9EURO|nr:primary-amine oxidase [Capronia epimyces CBS 606.96]EXJ86916.1 primary-amine oxidase [Capronia epimyces CBS 606.96]